MSVVTQGCRLRELRRVLGISIDLGPMYLRVLRHTPVQGELTNQKRLDHRSDCR